MAIGRTNAGGSGGAGLNFKVICNPQPSTAKENTIWVDTDKINNYYFSATQPENMAEYDVWFTVGTSSPVAFSATKKNPIMVYPLSAKQYVSGAWVDKTAKSYQGGEWVDWWNGELYRKGNEYTQITGGWEPAEFRFGEDYPYGEVTVTKTSTDMTIANTTTADRSGSISHKNALNLTGYTTLYVNVTGVSVYKGEFIAIIPEGELFLRNTNNPYLKEFTTGLQTLDFSNIDFSKRHFIVLMTANPSSGGKPGSFTVDDIWLE